MKVYAYEGMRRALEALHFDQNGTLFDLDIEVGDTRAMRRAKKFQARRLPNHGGDCFVVEGELPCEQTVVLHDEAACDRRGEPISAAAGSVKFEGRLNFATAGSNGYLGELKIVQA